MSCVSVTPPLRHVAARLRILAESNDGGYIGGGRCATCREGYTFVDDECSPCSDTDRNTMVISVWACAMCGVVGALALFYVLFRGVRRGTLGSDRLRAQIDAVIRGFDGRRHSFSLPTKAYIVLIAFQTLYQFSAITTMKSDSDLQCVPLSALVPPCCHCWEGIRVRAFARRDVVAVSLHLPRDVARFSRCY